MSYRRSPSSIRDATSHRGQQCRACGNTIKTAGWWGRCNRCTLNYRRHGHELQQPVTRADLKPFVEVIEKVRARNTQIDWKALHGRRESVVEIARRDANPYWTTPGVYTRFKHDRQAAEVLVQIADCIEPEVALNIVAGLYLMHTLQPSRFKANSRRSSDATRSTSPLGTH